MKNVKSLKSALVVVGGSIAAAPASALELGDVKVHSALGQPLRASISYALGPNESIADTCVSLLPAAPGGLPSVGKGSVSVANGVIAITGAGIVREPMVTMRVSIRCPYTPRLTREYLLLIDPAEPKAAPVAAPTAARIAAQPQLAPPPVLRESAPARPPIENASRYQVQPGDSLSQIAQRIANRPVGLWAAVNAIFAANPDAFRDGDPNKLKTGSWLTIPSFGADAPLAVAAAPAPEATDPAMPAGAAAEPAATQEVPEETVAAAPEQPLADLQPGDVIVNPDVAELETVAIPDTRLEGPETASTSPNVPVAVIRPATTRDAGGETNWLLWLGSAGIALILGLLLFGRRIFDRFGSTPIAPATPQRRSTDVATGKTGAIAVPDLQIDIPDDSPTAENLALDAELLIESSLQDSTDVDVASDFAFASTTGVDFELTEEMAGSEEQDKTDIIPPINIDESSILESEVLPEDIGDEYDMSVIVDATKMPNPEDVTERDLEAIPVDDEDENPVAGDYTVSQEVDYKILEQDYEDELTATQALNAEIQKAAEELATRSEGDEAAEEETAELPLATIHELDITAEMPEDGYADAISANDDAGANPTVSMDAADITVEMPKKGGKAS